MVMAWSFEGPSLHMGRPLLVVGLHQQKKALYKHSNSPGSYLMKTVEVG